MGGDRDRERDGGRDADRASGGSASGTGSAATTPLVSPEVGARGAGGFDWERRGERTASASVNGTRNMDPPLASRAAR